MAVQREHLLEREGELEAIRESVARAVRGLGTVVVIEGAAGLGKSRLLQEAVALAADAGCSTTTGRGSELEQEFAFGVVRQLFEARTSGLDRDDAERLFAGAAALARPLLEPIRAEEPAPGDDASYAALHGLHWLTANLAAGSPLVLAVDDAHWIDAPSLRFLAYLANRVDDLPVLLAVATRPFEPGARTDPLDELAASGWAHVLRPRALSPTAAREVVRSILGADPEQPFAHAAFDATLGNPLLLHELLTTLREEGAPPTADQVGRILGAGSPSVARSVRRRLRRVGHGAESLVRAVAVVGAQSDLRVAAALAGVSPQAAADLADALDRAAILDRRSGDFVHPLVRAAIYAEIPPGARGRLHGAAAGALAENGADDDEVALHVLAGEPASDGRVVDVLRRAARRARVRGAPDVAATYLQRAVAEPPPAHERMDVLVELGVVEAAAGRPSGPASLRQALRLARMPRARAGVSLELGGALMTSGRFAEAAAVFEAGLAELGEADSDLGQRLEGQLVSACFLVASLVPRALERLAPYMDDSARVSDPVTLATLSAVMAGAVAPASRAADVAERALRGGALAIERDPAVFSYAVTALMMADRLERAHGLWDRAIADAQRRGSIPAFFVASAFRAFVAVRLGDLSEAEADARAALEGVHGYAEPPVPLALTALVDVLVEKDELDEADRLLEEEGPGAELPATIATGFLLLSRGRLRTAQGRIGEALDDLRACGRGAEAWPARNPGAVAWRSALARALSAAGEQGEALALAHEEVELARRFAVPRELGMALNAAGVVAADDAGLALLHEACHVLESTPATLELARARTDLGAALRRRGLRATAREQLRAALDLAQRCGAGALAERAHTELLAAGARPRRLVRSGIGALTARERRVATMASEGMTNRQIAQALFVTEKTVETHLRHTYRKLDIRSRTELSRVLRAP